MKHTDKLKLARKMRTPAETKLGVPVFDSAEWKLRKAAKEAKQISKVMSILGKKGGASLKASKPADYYQKLGQKSAEVMKAKREAIEGLK